MLWLIVNALLAVSTSADTLPSLYPKPSESREVVSLDGIWDFTLSPPDNSLKGFNDKWFTGNLRELSGGTIPMPVPSSYNDITQEKYIRDHVGIVWYERKFFVPSSWSEGKRVWVRFGSVCYAAQVWVNGVLVASHEIGHLPFQQEITGVVNFGAENVITVAVDNTLLQTTIPQGIISEFVLKNFTKIEQSYTFDFFNYAGIDRSVFLFTTPVVYINDITVSTALTNNNNQGSVSYEIDYSGVGNETIVDCLATLLDQNGAVVVSGNGCLGTLSVTGPKLWWPYLMNPKPGYLYTLKAEISVHGSSVRDIYRQRVGIRSISWDSKNVLLNGKPIYIRGFGRHEDSDIRGKGLDFPLIAKDYNLIKWVGANAYRTSHYPYAEEIMDMADQEGIMIIDECPSVDTDIFTATLLTKHKTSLSELIRRDKNRPSVIMWSIANEPRSQHPPAEAYFGEVVRHVKTMDTSRPVTVAISRTYGEDKIAQLLDVISFNRYNSWYSYTGKTEVITDNVINEGENWFRRFNKPILMSEYGADAFAGLHIFPEYVWSEEYQTEVMMQHFKAFDVLRSRGWFIGEMIWNFADFMTAQTTTRVGGNRKGIFTRQRQPKASAHLLRKRYWKLAQELDGVSLPKGLMEYTSIPVKKRSKLDL